MATVIVPWRGGCPYRERAWKWVKARYEAVYPTWEVVLAPFTEEPWCKAKAVTPALRNAPSDVVVVADADCWSAGLESAVRAVTVGAAEWAIPHKIVYRLTEVATDFLIAENEYGTDDLERRPYEGVWGGGIVVAHRDSLLEVPMDPRFVGPGQEDEALGVALWTLLGPGWRGKEDLVHLHHPPLPRLSARRGSAESWALYKRYQLANRNPEAMRSLIEEFNDPSQPDEPIVRDHSPLAVGR